MAPVRALLTALASLILVGCGSADTAGDATTPSTRPSTDQTTTDATVTPDIDQENQMQITITIGEQRFEATLADSPAGRDLIDQLPLTIPMRDHGSVEKTGPLPAPLSLDGQPEGADPDIGDVGYYAPGNDFVLYYGDQSYYAGIVILGRLEDAAAERIAAMEGSVTATVEAGTD